MIENLQLIGLSDQDLDLLDDSLGYNEKLQLAINYELVKYNVMLLKSYGIKKVIDLLIYKHYLFLDKDLANKFNKFNIPVLVDLINADFSVVDQYF